MLIIVISEYQKSVKEAIAIWVQRERQETHECNCLKNGQQWDKGIPH